MTIPAIDYTARDYAGFRRMMLDAKRELMPEWTSESPNDFGIVLIELFSYAADILSFYQDRIATESFLTTATNRQSIVDIARTLDYRPSGLRSAKVDLEFTVKEAVLIPAGTQVSTVPITTESGTEPPVYFETLEDVDIGSSGTYTVSSAEGQTVAENLGSSDGRADQIRELDRFPVVDGSVRVFVNEGFGTAEWSAVDRLIEASDIQNAFSVEEDSNGAVVILFGDNVNGRVPTAGATIQSTYRVGTGERGNVGPDTLTTLVFASQEVLDAVQSVTNPQAAEGGSLQESAASIRRNVPRTFATQRRAVSLQDYSNLALSLGFVGKSNAVQLAYNTVTVFAAPHAVGDLAPSQLEQVSEFLTERSMSNVDVIVENPEYVHLVIELDIHVRDSMTRSQATNEVRSALEDLFAYDNVNFEDFMPISSVYKATGSVWGVAYSELKRMNISGSSGVENIQFGPNQIPVIEEIVINASGGIA